MKLVSQHEDPHPNRLGFTLTDYLELVDWAGREILKANAALSMRLHHPSSNGSISSPYRLMDHLREEAIIERPFMLGPVEKIKQTLSGAERKFVKGITEARRLFRPPLYT